MNIRLKKTLLVAEMKNKKEEFKEFMSEKRNLDAFPKTKKVLFILFLVSVNAYIWTYTVQEFKNTFKISFEYQEKVIESSVKNENIIYIDETDDVESKNPISETQTETENPIETNNIVSGIFQLESSSGKNNYSKCEDQGKYNGFGYGIPGDGTYMCFESHEEGAKIVKKWVDKKLAQGYSEQELLCIYNTGQPDPCEYYEKFKSIT